MTILLQAAQWLQRKRTVDGRRVIEFELQEQRIEREEIRLIEEMIRSFTKEVNKIVPSTKMGKIVYDRYLKGVNVKKLRKILNRLETDILRLEIYSKNISEKAAIVRGYLQNFKNARISNDFKNLSTDEERVIEYVIFISYRITQLATEVKNLSENISPGAYKSIAADSSKIREGIDRVTNGLVSLKTHLIELFTLEKEVEVLLPKALKA